MCFSERPRRCRSARKSGSAACAVIGSRAIRRANASPLHAEEAVMSNNRGARPCGWTRREALAALGTSVGLGLASEVLGAASANQATAPSGARAGAPRFSQGAVIRSLLSDLPPAKVGPGAVLFHEH